MTQTKFVVTINTKFAIVDCITELLMVSKDMGFAATPNVAILVVRLSKAKMRRGGLGQFSLSPLTSLRIENSKPQSPALLQRMSSSVQDGYQSDMVIIIQIGLSQAAVGPSHCVRLVSSHYSQYLSVTSAGQSFLIVNA